MSIDGFRRIGRLLVASVVVPVLLVVAPPLSAKGLIVPAPPQLAAEGYLLLDAATGATLVEFNANQRLPPASLTKIMTSYVAAEELKRGSVALSDEVEVSVKAWRMEGSKMFIREGTKVNFEDLLRGIVIQSGNDSSVALAEHIAGSEDAFAEVMNQYADHLGMSNTNFANSTGLPDENHFTTANDLARLTRSLINDYPAHYKMYSEKYFTYNNIRQPNRNKLLRRDSSVDGVKTGHTEAAGYCLIASAKRGNMRLISVVMGASSEESRATESQKLLTYGFRYFETAPLYKANESLKQVRVWGGQHGSVHVGLGRDVTLTIPKGSRADLKAQIDMTNEVHAIASECDLVLVVGSKNSSNSVRLTEIAEASGTSAYLIDDKSELESSWFDGIERVLITAGASAPEDLVREIVLHLIDQYGGEVEQRDFFHETIEFGLPLTLKNFMRAHGMKTEGRRIVRDDAVALDGWLEDQGIRHETVGMTIGATG